MSCDQTSCDLSGASCDLSGKGLTAVNSKMVPADTKNLLLHSNSLTSIPSTLFVTLSKSLTHLDLRNNHLRDLSGVAFPAGLIHLDFGFNELEQVHLSPHILPALEWLSLEGNKTLSHLPASLAEMESLTSLNVSRCQLTALLPGMAKMKSLRFLFARDNRITSLPPDWAGMALSTIAVSDNFLVALPLCWSLLPDLKTVFVGNNPLVLPPIEVCLGGVRDIQNFLSDIDGGVEAMQNRKDAIARAEAEATAHRVHRDAALAKLAEAEAYVERLRARAVDKEREIRDLTAELEQMKRALRARDSVHSAAREAAELIASLEKEKVAATAALTIARSEAKENAKRAAELEARVTRMSAEAEQLAKIREAEARSKPQEVQPLKPAPSQTPASAVSSGPSVKKHTLPAKSPSNSELVSKVEALGKDLQESQSAADRLRAEAADEKAKMRQQVERLEATIRSLTEQLANQKAETERSRKAFRDLEKALDLR